jgi:hypothetical protein
MRTLCDEGCRAADHVRFAVLDGYVVILDLRAGNYVALDERASAKWIALLRSVPSEGLTVDDEAFLDECERRGYLTRAAKTSRGAKKIVYGVPRIALSLWALYALIATTRRLKQQGFASEYAAVSILAPHDASNDPDDVRSAESAIALAENLYTGGDAPRDCLPRSLAIYKTLLRGGLAPVHRIGVSRMPFQAHAWVECGGNVVRDSADFVRQYTVIAELS